jgi:hypothetical protein
MPLQDESVLPPPPDAPAPPTADDPGRVLEVASEEELLKAVSRSQGEVGIGPEHIVVTGHLDLSNQAIGEPQAFFYDNARSVRVRQLADIFALLTSYCFIC